MAFDTTDHTPEQDPPEEGWVYVYSSHIPRAVLSESMYEEVLRAAVKADPIEDGMDVVDEEVVQSVLASVGFLSPASAKGPDPFACEALWPDRAGRWLRCEKSVRPHDEHHCGDHVWTDSFANAIPAPVYSTEPPF